MRNPWVSYPKPTPEAVLRLFCFPSAGGNASLFRHWAYKLSARIEVGIIQLPGRESRMLEPAFTQLPALIQALAPALLPELTMPFAFFGHSMGALVCFELARYLRNRYDVSPQGLLVAASCAPNVRSVSRVIHCLPEVELLTILQELNGIPMEVLDNPELRELIMPTLRADLEICDNYAYVEGPPLTCPVTVLGGLEDNIPLEQLNAWRSLTIAAFSCHMLPGDHFFSRTSKTLLLQKIMQALNTA